MAGYFKSATMVTAIAAIAWPGLSGVSAQVPGTLVYTVIIPAGEFGSPAYLGVLVSGLGAIRKFCSEIKDSAYRVDCLAERFGALARTIPKGSDYAEVQAALQSASNRMAELARKNRDRSRPRGRATRPGTTETTSRPLTPVTADSVTKVNRQATAILDETQTLLLRSAQGSQSKISQYAKIADAIGSNKVLLRAA